MFLILPSWRCIHFIRLLRHLLEMLATAKAALQKLAAPARANRVAKAKAVPKVVAGLQQDCHQVLLAVTAAALA